MSGAEVPFSPSRVAPYIQFVGRVMRVVIQNDPDHPDNRGYIVSHVGLNNETRWEEFRELDLEDQALLQEWLRGQDVVRAGLGTGSGPNTVTVTKLLNLQIREFAGGKNREDLTADEAEAAFQELDNLGDAVLDRISEALGRTS